MSIRNIKRTSRKAHASGANKPGPGARLPFDLNSELARARRSLQAGQRDQAAAIFKQILAFMPGHDYSLHTLGMIAQEAGDYQEARKLIEKSIRINPGQPAYYNNLGLLLENLGKGEEALLCFDQALAIKADIFEILSNKGKTLKGLGQYAEALDCYKKALSLNLKDPGIYLNMGNLFIAQGSIDKAIASYKEAVRVSPDLVEAHNNLGSAFRARQDYLAAIECYREMLRLQPDSVEACKSIGNTFKDDEKYEDAIVWYEKYQQLRPNEAEPLLFLGDACFNLGDLEQATAHYRKALEKRGDSGHAARMLAQTRKYLSVEDEDALQFKTILGKKGLGDGDAMNLHFALGKIYDDCGLYQQAFAHYQQGNLLKHQESLWDSEKFISSIERTISSFGQDIIKELQQFGSISELPVFIVGMPRSGTSLIEQIISSHAKVQGAGELKKIATISSALDAAEGKSGSNKAILSSLAPAAVHAAAEEYLEFLARNTEGRPLRISDKMPYNFQYLGLISILFPQARIIHCRRHPLDTCLSIFFQLFTEANQYAYDLVDIGIYYRQYERLMAHWRQVLSANMFEIQYDELLVNQEDVTRELIDFLGLAWDEHCLSFYENRRAVKTASMWQVRQPLYKDSVQRWRNYEEYLGPLKETLGLK